MDYVIIPIDWLDDKQKSAYLRALKFILKDPRLHSRSLMYDIKMDVLLYTLEGLTPQQILHKIRKNYITYDSYDGDLVIIPNKMEYHPRKSVSYKSIPLYLPTKLLDMFIEHDINKSQLLTNAINAFYENPFKIIDLPKTEKKKNTAKINLQAYFKLLAIRQANNISPSKLLYSYIIHILTT